MKYLFFLFISFLSTTISFSQESNGYVLEVEGDSISISLDEAVKYKMKDGKTINIKLRRKEFLDYSKGPVSFSYPSAFSVTSTMIDEDSEQILLMSAIGTGVMVQIYSSINPQGIVDFLLDQLTDDDKNAGYSETKHDVEKKISNGIQMKGKKSVLKMDNDERSISVYAYSKGKKGILIIELASDLTDESQDDKKLLNQFWSTVRIQY